VCVDAKDKAVWNQVLELPVTTSVTAPCLNVTVLDKETLLSDKVIGSVQVALDALVRQGPGATVPRWYPLTTTKGKAGEVRLALQFTPYVLLGHPSIAAMGTHAGSSGGGW
jgi:hypothetical protein